MQQLATVAAAMGHQTTIAWHTDNAALNVTRRAAHVAASLLNTGWPVFVMRNSLQHLIKKS